MTGTSLINVGSETEKGVVSALDDLFGPSFREMGEYLADKVRLHRLKSLRKILERAKEFGPAGAEFLAPPSLKFLLTYTEKASLEESEELADLWARLLLTATKNEQVQHLYFADTIAKIGPAEANIIEELVLNPKIPRGSLNQIVDAWLDYRPHRLGLVWEDAIQSSSDEREFFLNFFARVERRGARVLSLFRWSSNDDDEFYSAEPWEGYSDRIMSFLLLHQLGVIHFDEQLMIEVDGEQLSCVVAYLTPLGAEFFFATHDPEWRKSRDRRADGSYPDDDFIGPFTAASEYIHRFRAEDVLGRQSD